MADDNAIVPENGKSGNHISPRLPHASACGAKTRSGGQCRQPAMPNGRCRLHGGKTPHGIASPNYKHGMHSKYMPKHLQADYHRAVDDPQLLSLQSQLALLTARELELTRQLAEMDSPPWSQAVDALVDFEEALASKDRQRIGQALAALRSIIRRGEEPGSKYEAVWAELRELVQEKAKVTTGENKRLELIGGYVSINALMLVLQGILEAVRANVSDMKARQAIQTRYNELVGGHGQGAIIEAAGGDAG
jgi:hypothetical protein